MAQLQHIHLVVVSRQNVQEAASVVAAVDCGGMARRRGSQGYVGADCYGVDNFRDDRTDLLRAAARKEPLAYLLVQHLQDRHCVSRMPRLLGHQIALSIARLMFAQRST